MSLVAGRTVTPAADDVPDTDDGGEKINAGSFWPEIALRNIRVEMRINGAVTTSRLKHAAIEALAHVVEQLTTWQAHQKEAGFARLDEVPATAINGESIKVIRFRRAVYSLTRALLIENYRDVDSTGDAGEKHAAGLTLQAADLWRDVRWAIADIQGNVRSLAEVF
ncbi:head completion/stabilization protein [Serratia rubidaea]|uniref:head completion/stabilization protein n=1 Tax=Serratia TaxID=613 RepID=UPI00193227EF|nr:MULTISPECIES: head completion/stabilization protein [Serratia]UJD79827.1 head completion/stabilization protein [Serratia rubidaea]UJD84383.1 head completion/stabilization protein [Serratia rubidaea]CAE1144993.1 Capsid assembly protein [Serratia sp. Tan611]